MYLDIPSPDFIPDEDVNCNSSVNVCPKFNV